METKLRISKIHEFDSRAFSDLTLCIVTNGARKQRLERTISFAKNLGLKCLVLDAGKEPLSVISTELFTYLHFPQESGTERLMRISKLVKTKYVLLSPDDDFFLPRGIHSCIEFLEDNPDYASAQGQRIYFSHKQINEWGPSYEEFIQLDFYEEDLKKRLLRMNCGMHFIYSIMRIEAYTGVISTLKNTDSENPNSVFKTEYAFSYLLALFGKHRILPVLFSARERHPTWYGNLSFDNWINDIDDQGAINFKRNISRVYASRMNLSLQDAEELERQITEGFMRRTKAKKIKIATSMKFSTILGRYVKLLPFNVYDKIVAPLRFAKIRPYVPVWRKSSWKYYLGVWMSGNIVCFYKDLSILLDFLKRKTVSD